MRRWVKSAARKGPAMAEERHPLHRAYFDALDAGGPASIPVGRTVLCDACDTDLTNDTRSGG